MKVALFRPSKHIVAIFAHIPINNFMGIFNSLTNSYLTVFRAFIREQSELTFVSKLRSFYT